MPCVVAGTGYTGEDGVEVAVPADAAGGSGTRCSAAGSSPAGLGARDTLRLEAGLPLHGHELGPGITPLQAGLGWVVGWDKGGVPWPGGARGRAGAGRGTAPARAAGRGPPAAPGRQRGAASTASRSAMVTSGNFSPMLGHGIALAFLPPEVEEGTAVEVDLRGTHVPAQVVPTPFV